MQLLDMKSLRTIFYSRKHFLISSSFSSYKTSPISCRSSLSPNSSLFHYAPRFNTAHLSTDARNGDPLAGSGPENEKRRNVWSLYGSVSSKLTTQRVGSSSDGKEPEQSLGVLNGDGAEDSLNEKTSESVRKVGLDDKLTCKTNSGKLAGLKKKSKVSWVCSDCGHSEGQWWGTCQSCRKVGTMKQFSVGNDSEGGSRTWLPKQVTNVNPMRLTDVNRGINAQDWRLPL